MLLALSGVWFALVALAVVSVVAEYRSYRAVSPGICWNADRVPRVSVIVPARNSETVIARCLSGLLQQDYPAERFEVIVIDDESQDRTAEVVSGFVNFDARVRLIPGGAPPDGWTDRAHACWQGAFAADGDWLCFVDAEVVAAPSLLRVAVSRAQTACCDLLSLAPRQELITFWERVILPAESVLRSILRSLRRDSPSLVMSAAGDQFVLIRREAYGGTGGHAAVRRATKEGWALARLVERSGRKISFEGAEHLARVRRADNLTQLWRGISRSAVETTGGMRLTLCLSLAGLVLGWTGIVLFILSAFQVFTGSSEWSQVAAFGLNGCGLLALLGVHALGASCLTVATGYGMLFPLGYGICALAGLNSVWECWVGRRSQRGHLQGPSTRPASAHSKQA